MNNSLKTIGLAMITLFVSLQTLAGEGMWLPQLLQTLNERDMKKQGMKINASDIYSINKSSLKDAIVSLGGCTAEIISGSGLMLTNHHCGFDAIQNHSSLEKNYIRDGFWAKNWAEELPNPGLTATFIIRIDDVTDAVLKGISSTLNERERQSAIDKRLNDVRAGVKKEAYQDVIIRPFFEGNKYYQFITEVYKDVRLVGAPPSSIGNFGKDTDNWMWPRHTGDFSLFRIYAGRDNRPATYSPDNVPYKPKRALNISLDGVQEGDFTMVFGFPGRTMQYLHSSAVEQIVNEINPARITLREKALGVLDEHMRADEQTKIQYASKYARIANAYKKWQGESLGLKSKNAVAKKKQYEAAFQKAVASNPTWNSKYENLLSDLEEANKQLAPYALAREIYVETMSKPEIFAAAGKIRSLLNPFASGNNNTSIQEHLNRSKGDIDTFYAEYSPVVDRRVFEVVMAHYLTAMDKDFQPPVLAELLSRTNTKMEDVAEALYATSILADHKKLQAVFALPQQQLIDTLMNDPAYQLYAAMQSHYSANIAGKTGELQARVNSLQREYMKAQMEVITSKTFYPDANSTLRVTYGNAKGMKPRNGITYSMMTDLDGVMEKYIPGDYEFDVPAKLIDLHARKDYGRYGVNGKMPVCFIATNHTTGGNSGSPALDAYGNLVGLNFDRAWEGTMSDIYYNEDICRNIMVDIRYVLFIIDKFAGAQNLINEMKFVHPKKKTVPQKKQAA